MKILVTGAKGQLGKDLTEELTGRGHAVIEADIDNMDITDADAVMRFMKEAAPEAVIHCAAYTNTDKAEDEPEICRAVNATGTRNIAVAAKALGIKMLYISTDYVFDGNGEAPWHPDCKDHAPINVYGRSKLEGELAVSELLSKYFIVRIAWDFGANGKNGVGF